MKINNFQGDQTDVSNYTKSLLSYIEPGCEPERGAHTQPGTFFFHQSFTAKMQHNREKPDDDLICKNDSCL